MEIIILAETNARDSYQEGISVWYKQYAVGHNMTNDERQQYYDTWKEDEVFTFQNPSATMRRRVDMMTDGTIQYREWDMLGIEDGVTKAANAFGDSEYYTANSKDTLHVQAIKLQRRWEGLKREDDDLFREKNSLKDVFNRKYETEMKSRRLWSKAQEGVAPQEVVDEVRSRLRAEYASELERIEKRHNEIMDEMKSISGE